jgi:DNA polymerase-3 subunit epsilon
MEPVESAAPAPPNRTVLPQNRPSLYLKRALLQAFSKDDLTMNHPTLLALDFETANYSPNSACQLGIVRIESWRVVDARSWYIRPPTDEFVFTYLHGIAWEHVEERPHWGELWPELAPHFEGVDYLAAHNAPFDQGVLRAACAEYGLVPPPQPFVDTVALARKVWKIFPTKLNLVCERLGIELNHHEALSDARACAEILIRAGAEGWTPEA